MSADRWSDETVETVAQAIHHPQSGRWVGADEDYQDYCRDRARVVLAVLDDDGLLVEPGGETRTWTLPAEPGPEVTAVLDCDGELWVRNAVDWHMHDVTCVPDCLTTPRHGSHSWAEVLSLFGPLAETSHPTAAATAGAVPVSAEATAAPGSGGSDLPSDPP